MSEPRKADAVVTLQTRDRKTGQVRRHKLELYASDQFPSADMQDQRQVDDNDVPTVRVRHNGVWLPPGQRQLMTMAQVMGIIERTAAQPLRKALETRP